MDEKTKIGKKTNKRVKKSKHKIRTDALTAQQNEILAKQLQERIRASTIQLLMNFQNAINYEVSSKIAYFSQQLQNYCI